MGCKFNSLTTVSKEIDVEVIANGDQPQSVADESCWIPILTDEHWWNREEKLRVENMRGIRRYTVVE